MSDVLDRSNRDKKIGFDEFMKQPLLRAMLSTLAPSENLEVIIKAAFEAGYNAGLASIMIELLSMPKKKD